MGINENTRLKVMENFLTLEKGRDEFIPTDYVNLQPIYIKRKEIHEELFESRPKLTRSFNNIAIHFLKEENTPYSKLPSCITQF